MITITSGDLFKSEAQTLVNATNTEGIMGGGIALAFKKRYPAMYSDYVLACKYGVHTTIRPHLFRPHKYSGDPWILSLATKDLVRNDSSLTNIADGLFWLLHNYKEQGIESIAFPALGCGLGGLKWKNVKPLMEAFLERLDIPVWIYEPQ